MGGDLQPFFAQRNMDPATGMTSNKFVSPAPDTRADHQLAVALAQAEHQQGPMAATAHRSAAAFQPAGHPATLRMPSNQGTMLPPDHIKGGQYYGYQNPHSRSSSGGGSREQALPLQPYGYRPAAPPSTHGYSMQGGGTPVANRSNQPELWRVGSGGHFDDVLGRQMSGVVAVPHTPRVNAEQPAPETSEMVRKRLEMRLKTYGLCERKIKGDGNCQFRAVADQLYRDAKYHEDVRRIAVHHLRCNPGTYSQFVPTDYWRYCWDMEQQGCWGDHVTLQAIADAFGLKINVLTSYPDSPFIGITPANVKSHRVLYLSFWAEIHYQSLFPKSDPPKSNKLLGSKKLHRLFS